MSLTNNDLAAIKDLIDGSIDSRVPAIIKKTVQPMFDEAALQTAAALEEVHNKIDAVEVRLDKKIDGVESRLDKKIDSLANKLDVKDGKLQNTVERVDVIELQLSKLSPKTA